MFALMYATAVSGTATGADLTLNISFIAESNPLPPISPSTFSYADVWSESGYAYVGSDRSGRGTAIFSLSNSGVPTFLAQYDGIGGDGSEYEDVEVYDGVGYFSADASTTSGTGVDIVDLSIPFDPLTLGRVNSSDCLAGNPSVCAHNKVHTLSIQRINAGLPSEQRFLYTTDNATTDIKITDVTNPSSPQLVRSLSLIGIAGVDTSVDSHEIVVRNNRMYVASKDPGNQNGEGYVHIYDVTTPANPVLLKGFLSGASTHTAMPTDDGKSLIVGEERTNGNVKIYDITNIDTPVLKRTLNRSTVCISAGNCLDAHSPHHVHPFGNLLFMPWYESGLVVLNISDPSQPRLVGAFDTFPGTSGSFNGNWGVDLSRGLKQVLLSDRSRGLIVVDASAVVLPGDYNQDMVVNDLDYAVWKSSFGSTRSGAHDLAFADGNYDGSVNAADYVLWRQNYGQTQSGPVVGVAPGSAVPEPGCFVLLALGVAVLGARRRNRAV